MAKSGTLTIKIAGDAGGFNKAMNGVQGKLSSFGSTALKVGKTAALGLGAAAVGAAALGTEVLNTGAKLTTWRLKTATVFEGSAKDVRKWADSNNEAFGVTDDELAGLAASFGDLLKPMGFTAQQAADMSMDVVGLSGALSEWTGGQRSAAEVSDILAKAMLGERESLKELGISITEADVQQRLLTKGQGELTGAALAQAKAIATQELIFWKSKDAQEAYAEGGNEALRASNGLKAGLAELREQLADRLLPIVTTITQWMADNLPTAMAKAEEIAGTLKAKWDEVFPALKSLAETLSTAVQTAADVIVAAVTFIMDEWDKFKVAIGVAVGIMIPHFVSLGTAAVVSSVKQIAAWAANVAATVAAAVVHSVQVAIMIAKWVALGAVAVAQAALIAGAWLISMGPIALVVAAVVGLAAAFILHWSTIKNAVLTGVQFVVNAMLIMAEKVVGAGVSAFGWVPGVGDKLREAQAAVARFRENVNAELDQLRDKTIRIDIVTSGLDGLLRGIQLTNQLRGGRTAGLQLHAGGTFNTPRPGGEGMVLLRDGERVSTPTEPAAAHGGMVTLDPQSVRDLARAMLQMGRAG